MGIDVHDMTPLRRVITRNMLLLLIVGDVLGAGIYALVGEVGAVSAARSGPRSRWRSC